MICMRSKSWRVNWKRGINSWVLKKSHMIYVCASKACQVETRHVGRCRCVCTCACVCTTMSMFHSRASVDSHSKTTRDSTFVLFQWVSFPFTCSFACHCVRRLFSSCSSLIFVAVHFLVYCVYTTSTTLHSAVASSFERFTQSYWSFIS